MHRAIKIAIAALLATLSATTPAQNGAVGAPRAVVARSTAAPLPALTAQNVRAWADRDLAAMVTNGGASGVVVSVVHRGQIVYEAGYGLADVVTRQRADARTRVRIGSNSKTFTATIIAQLMEEGRIRSLEDPANQYLRRYHLPPNGRTDIRLRHLLTHTAGYADRFYFIGADTPVAIPVDARLFDTLRPEFARPADEQVVYSNFAVATLGLVIEDMTGMPINQAMQRRIFDPLGMRDSELAVTINEPARLARPGRIDGAGRVTGPVPFTAINPAAAQTGSIVSTAHDMALYMNAQLGHGSLLSPALRQRLHHRLVANAPEGAGIAMVFIEDGWAGHRIVGHGGNWEGFHSWFTLMPDQDVGIFVAILGDVAPTGISDRFLGAIKGDWANPPSRASLSAAGVSSSFFGNFYGPPRHFAAASLSPAQLEAYVGPYRADRRPFSTSERLSALVYFGGDVTNVTAKADGLYLDGAGPFVPQGNGRFMLNAPARTQIVLRPNPRTGTMVLAPQIGVYTMSRIASWQNPKYHAIAVHILVPLAALGLLTPLFFGWKRRVVMAGITGLGAAGIIGASTLGLAPGEALVSSYFNGHMVRIGTMIFAADVMLIASLLTLWDARRWQGRWRRLWPLLVGSAGLGSSIILACYGGIALWPS